MHCGIALNFILPKITSLGHMTKLSVTALISNALTDIKNEHFDGVQETDTITFNQPALLLCE